MGTRRKKEPPRKEAPRTKMIVDLVLNAGGEVPLGVIHVEIGKLIPATHAVAEGRMVRTSARKAVGSNSSLGTIESLAKAGRQHMINTTISDLVSRGLIRRVRKGVYAPPLPKLLTEAPIPKEEEQRRRNVSG